MLVGLTLIRNGNRLRYPWKQCISSLDTLCDQVIVNCDVSSDDGTAEDLNSFCSVSHHTKVCASAWDMDNTGDGRELAYQVNIMLPYVPRDAWVVYMQADEMIHEKDFENLHKFIHDVSSHVSQIELFRTYFWRDLQHRLSKEEIWLGRIFRAGTHEVGGDGMYLVRKQGDVIRSPFWIYHYSRIGSEKDITNRVRTLDRLFHPEEEVQAYQDFQYGDQRGNLLEYGGTHPKGIEEFYNE